jgi:hypothetical protein
VGVHLAGRALSAPTLLRKLGHLLLDPLFFDAFGVDVRAPRVLFVLCCAGCAVCAVLFELCCLSCAV